MRPFKVFAAFRKCKLFKLTLLHVFMVAPTDVIDAVTQKIGEGRYREVYCIDDEFALKLLKPIVGKNYFGVHVEFPAQLYTSFKFGISDFNRFEYDAYHNFSSRIPSELRSSFAHIYRAGIFHGRSASLSDLIVDEDGSVSRPLSEHGAVGDPLFWKRMDAIETMLLDEKIRLADVANHNIVVQTVNGTHIPVLVDFKRYGRRTFPFQIWLVSERQLENKMRRRFQKMRDAHKGT